jgi:L-lactate dehydrogenase
MKVAIIGGGGRVGICAGFALQCGGIAAEIILNDIAADLVQGEALDLLHGTALLHDQRICVGDMKTAAQADIVIITAGLRRKPEESRLDLINRNVSLFLTVLDDLKSEDLRKDAILVVVSNPVDILTHLAVQKSGLPPQRVIGLGTLLDTARFCSMIADVIKAAPTQVKGFILGEHGDSMVPVWSSATLNGFSLEKHPDLPPAAKNRVFERTRQSGAEMIRLKGGAGWAVGASITALVHSIILDQRKLLPVSSIQTGAYGLQGVCLSVPTLVGRAGVLKHVELELWPREIQALKSSAQALGETLKRIQT